MRRGIKIAIVVVVAMATNFGLHAAFGWGRHHHWRGHHDYYRNHHDCNPNMNNNNFGGHTSDPWNCDNRSNDPSVVKDTLQPK